MEPALLIVSCVALLVAALVTVGALRARPTSESARMRRARRVATRRITERAAAHEHFKARAADPAASAVTGDDLSHATADVDAGGAGGGDGGGGD